MRQKFSPKLVSLVFGVLVLCFLIGFYVFAWTEPSGPPPTENVSPPITSEIDPIFIGSIAAGMTMTGKLTINTSANDKILLRGTQTDPHTIWLGDSKGLRFWDSVNGELMRITNTGNISWKGSLTGGSIPWARLTSFPAACSSGQYVTAVGSSLTCSTPPAGISNAFAKIANDGGTVQFPAASEDTLRISAGSGLSIAYDGATKKVTYSVPTGGITSSHIADGTITNIDISATAAISGSKISGWNATNWNTAYGWGNHALAGYLTSETDPQVGLITTVGKWCTTDGTKINCASDAPSTENNYVNSISFNTTNGILTLGRLGLSDLTKDLDGRYLTTEIDPYFITSPAYGISSIDITNWNTWTTWRDNLNRSLTGNLTVGTGSGIIETYKIRAQVIDPIFNIDGEKYATYMADFAGGVRVETSGVIELNSEGKYIIDFDNLEKGSDLWLFWQASNKNLDPISVLLTPSFEGKTWYKKDKNVLIIYGDKDGEVSYRLSAPRVDYQKWDNLAEDQTLEGIEVIK